jgi:DNA-binding transcriptional MocR family regulator
MATKKPVRSLRGDIDTTYMTQQRDMFESGLVADIGVNAYAVWNAIKCHADFETGVAWPGIRRLVDLCGISNMTVQAAIKTLQGAHMLRVNKRGRRSNEYVARERMDVRVGDRVICTVVVDYVPATMRARLAKLKGASGGDLSSEDVWAEVELIPGPGLKLDESSGTFKTEMRADEVPEQVPMMQAAQQQVSEAKEKLRLLAIDMKANPTPKKPLKK